MHKLQIIGYSIAAGLAILAISDLQPVSNSATARSYAIKAHANAVKAGITNSPLVAYVDFTKPSTEKRFFIYDTKNHTQVFSTYTAHGRGSGLGAYPRVFSNISGSKASSLGTYITTATYSGKHGYSLRIKGLDQGLNNNALSRTIVVHGASYAGKGKTGTSWGCFAVPYADSTKVINYIKNGVVIFAYYPDSKLMRSKWLK
jgi:hypothetical protein